MTHFITGRSVEVHDIIQGLIPFIQINTLKLCADANALEVDTRTFGLTWACRILAIPTQVSELL